MNPKPYNRADPMPLDNKHSKDIDMKKQDTWLYVIGGAATIAIAIVLYMYLSQFGDKKLSVNVAEWGQFGDYVGGSLNPLLSFLGLMALLYTIRLQKEELETSREAAQKQAAHFEAEAKRIDLYRIIEKLAKEIDFNYKESKTTYIDGEIGYGNYTGSIAELINSNQRLHEKLASLKTQFNGNLIDNIELRRVINLIEEDLKMLAIYLYKYDKTYNMATNSPVVEYYIREYSGLIAFLGSVKIIDIIGLDIFTNTKT